MIKLHYIFLLLVCIIGCTSYGDDEDEIRGIFPSDSVTEADTESQTASQTALVDDVNITDECPPDLHGEHITGTFNSEKSELKHILVNDKRLRYCYTLNLELNASTVINIDLEEAILASSWKLGDSTLRDLQLADEDLLLVKLDRILEPGVWKGLLVKNLTRNISF